MKETLNKQMEKIECFIGIGLTCIILLVLFFFLNRWYLHRMCEDTINQMQEMTTNVFSLDKIICYSSAYANNTSSSSLFNLAISQFTDFAIFMNNHAEGNYTLENTIKECYIDHIAFSPLPKQGTPYLYPKNLNTFGKVVTITEQDSITDSFSFPIVESKDLVHFENFELASTCSTPIVLEYVNQNILTNYYIPSETNPSLDGNLLKQAGIPFSSMETNLSFQIHIINGLEEHFICPIHLAIPLRDENNRKTIYNGSFVQEFTSLSNHTFLKKISE